MPVELHPKACENFNVKSDALKYKLSFFEPPPQKPIKDNPNIHVAAHFDETNIVGPITIHKRDNYGKISARTFRTGDRLIGLFDENHQDLNRIAEGIQKSLSPKQAVSEEFLASTIFKWLELQYKGESATSMTDFVLEECNKLVIENEVWIPVTHVHIAFPFTLGKITFRVITKKFMDDYEESILSKIDDEEAVAKVRNHFNEKRGTFQNLVVATIKVEAEPKQAYKIASIETEKTLDVLRFFCPVNMYPLKTCYVARLGKQHMDGDDYFIVKNNKVKSEISGISDRLVEEWVIDRNSFEQYSQIGLRTLHELLVKEELTDFQQKLLDALTLYSKGIMSKELSDKLVYLLVALESLFLKDSSEIIQDNVALRMAYLHPVELSDRKKIINNFKEVYKLRSSFMHHGKHVSVQDLETLEFFLRATRMTFFGMIQCASQNIKRDEFFDYLENRKIGA